MVPVSQTMYVYVYKYVSNAKYLGCPWRGTLMDNVQVRYTFYMKAGMF